MGFSLKSLKGTIAGAVAAPFTGGLSLAAGAAYDYVQNQKELQKQQNKANQKAIDKANAYDLYTWDLANQYNDPVHQMQRLKAAGLNPNLVYGSGNVTGNTSGVAHSNGAADYGVYNAASDIISKGLPFAQGLANLRNTNTQNRLLEYQMGQTQAQTDSIIANTRNLNNFLNGTGRSTFDPVIQKNVDVVTNKVQQVGKKVADVSSPYWKTIGDFWYYAKHAITGDTPSYSPWKGVK